MDTIPVQHVRAVTIVNIANQAAEHVAHASRVNSQQAGRILQYPGRYLLILRKKLILLNAERQQRKERGAAEVQDQMDIAGSMEGEYLMLIVIGI